MSAWHVALKARLGSLDLDVDLNGDANPLALIGPNGSGKTTLLRLISGAVKPASGEIELDGTVVFSSRGAIHVPAESRRVGYVPQGYALFPHLRVIDNVAFGLSTGIRRVPKANRHESALAMLRALECDELAQRFVRRLSSGEQQRVALARALVIEPALLLLDEPLSALDAGARRKVRAFLADRLLSLGRPSIVVTHDVRDVIALGAEVCVLEAGRVVQRGTLEQLRAEPGSDFVAEFVDAIPR